MNDFRGDFGVPEESAPPEPIPPFRLHTYPAFGFILIISGVIIMAGNGMLEIREFQAHPWSGVIWGPDGEPAQEQFSRVQVRRLSMDNFPRIESTLNTYRANVLERQREEMERQLAMFGIEETEWVVRTDIPVEEFELLLESGRLPKPGEPEVIAGVFARLDSFELDGTTFTVTGRLAPYVSGFHFAYLLPSPDDFDELFVGHEDATEGWLDTRGRETMDGSVDVEKVYGEQDVIAGQTPTRRVYGVRTLFGLLLVAVGGAIAHIQIFTALATRNCGPLSASIRAVREHPRWVWGFHFVYYGSFLGMMCVSMSFPVLQIWLLNLITHTFEEGNLSYIGDAYGSQNILNAAVATWVNNYLLQTVVLTVLISFVVPMLGLLKTMMSFVLVGFGMAPIWTGMAMTYSFHSITMTLELEAYIFACFFVWYFWKEVFRGLQKDNLKERLKQGFKVVTSGTLLAGVMLGIAGLYEAASLILLR